MLIGYHASHEQFAPSKLLEYAQAAERAGFQAIMTSDHIAPWSERQANSGNNWAWLGAALATTSLPFGSLAIPGGWRYHPALLAHLIATLAEMYPKRLRWIAVGSGEALNESVVGLGWPPKEERNARLQAGAEMVKNLLQGKVVTASHPWFKVEQARMWSPPDRPPPIFGAALTAETASWMGSWADGLITVRKPAPELKEIVQKFRAMGGDKCPVALQLQISWANSKDDARLAAWDQWRNAAAPPAALATLRQPKEFDEITKDVQPEEIDDVIPLITQGRDLLDIIDESRSYGFDEIYSHNVSPDQEGFMNFMSAEVLREIG